MFWLSTSIFFLLYTHLSHAQQTYVNNTQLDCDDNTPTGFGYTCNATSLPSCRSYVTFRPQPPLYTTPSSIATLLNSNPNHIATLNNLSSTSATIPATTIVLVPVPCSCSHGGWYQHNASYVLKNDYENYFTLANNTFQGLTTCQALITQNPYNYRNLFVGNNITVPIRCACPTPNQTAAGVRYLVTYLVTWDDYIEYISTLFEGADVQSILDANELSERDVIFPFTPILVPLRNEPTRINNFVTPPPPPAPPVIPVFPVSGSGGGMSGKWVFVGVGIGVGLLVIVLVLGFGVWLFRKTKIQRDGEGFTLSTVGIPPVKHSTMGNSLSITSEGIRIAVGSLTVYKYEDLQSATEDFSEDNKVKRSVYKGVFNGDFAAVKILKGDVSGEINILKQINHSNIIRLSGFGLHQGNTYLVYEFADNGSVSDWLHLHSNLHAKNKNNEYESGLDWKHRVQIAYDVADALNYLHNFITPPYIHKNLKSSNVLLDTQMRGKITNFGLAISVKDDNNGELQLTRHVVGTFGYMPPEYMENGLITPKMDVFALGVIISELLSGREAVTGSLESSGGVEKDAVVVKEVQLSEMIKDVVRGGENVREKLVGFMDDRLGGEYPMELAYSMAEIANRCVAADLNDRPSIAVVFATLAKILSSSLDWDPSDELEHSSSLAYGR